jgi:hypothetical protein
MRNIRSIIIYALGLSASLIIFIACGNESNDPTLAQANLEMKAVTLESSIKNGRTKATAFEFTEIVVGVTEIEFEALEEDDDDYDDESLEDSDNEEEDDNEEIEFEGNFVVDLIRGTSTPDFGIANLTPGLYEEIKIKMEPILDGGNTVFISFNFLPDGGSESITVEYSNSLYLEIEIEDESGFSLDAGTVNQILVVLDLDKLFVNIDLINAVADSDGIIRINNNSNQDLAPLINSNFKDALDGDEDEDGDGEIEDED